MKEISQAISAPLTSEKPCQGEISSPRRSRMTWMEQAPMIPMHEMTIGASTGANHGTGITKRRSQSKSELGQPSKSHSAA